MTCKKEPQRTLNIQQIRSVPLKSIELARAQAKLLLEKKKARLASQAQKNPSSTTTR